MLWRPGRSRPNSSLKAKAKSKSQSWRKCRHLSAWELRKTLQKWCHSSPARTAAGSMGKYCALTVASPRVNKFALGSRAGMEEKHKKENGNEESNSDYGSIERFRSVIGACTVQRRARRVREHARHQRAQCSSS